MAREQITYLADIVREARRAQGFVADCDWPTFQADVRRQYAVQHALLILGEAVSRLDQRHQQALAELPLRQIIGMRNRVAHEYWTVDPAIVWQVVTEELAPLLTATEALIAASG